MALDLQYVQYQDVVPVKRIGLVAGFYPPAFDIYGRDFRQVSDVLINDQPVQEFVVLSQTRLVAQLPRRLADTRIERVMVLSKAFTATEQSLLKFRLAPASRLAKGLPKLVQTYVKLLITTPGSDIYDKEAGGGLMALHLRSGNRQDRSLHLGAFAACVARTQDQLVREQTNRQLPLTEKLLSADLVSVDFDPNSLTIKGRVRLTSMAGSEALANLAAEAKEVS